MLVKSVEFQDTYIKEIPEKHTVFQIKVISFETHWIIHRRYNDFYYLFQQLKINFPGENLQIPKKRYFGNNFDPSFINDRKAGLFSFICAILEHPHLSRSILVRNFLSQSWEGSNSSGSETDVSDWTADNIRDLAGTENVKASVDDFDLLKVIGKGSFGKVVMAKHKETSKIFAIKILSKKHIKARNEVKHIMSERNVLLKNLQHPFLVGLHYSFQSKDKLYFVLTYVNGGELFFHLQNCKTFSESRTRFYSAEITSALEYLHSNGVVYRDLKPENILLDHRGHIILTDFGLSKEGIEPGDTTSTFCGTPEYLAPEMLKKQSYGYAIDWWCLGAVTYEMLTGLPPFYSNDNNQMYEKILNETLKFPTNLSPIAVNFMSLLLEKDPSHRLGYGINDAQDVKNHIFFEGIDWIKLYNREYPTPFDPSPQDDFDIKNFDTEFTNQSISPQQSFSATFDSDNPFVGFTYTHPNSQYLNDKLCTREPTLTMEEVKEEDSEMKE